MPDALIEFIEARLAEDENAAYACQDPGGGRVWHGNREPGSDGYVIQTRGGYVVARIGRDDVRPGAVAAFIAAHDPYRAMRRVQTLRGVLATLAEQDLLDASPTGDNAVTSGWLRVVLRGIAAAEWGEHPGYGAAIEGF